MKVWNNNLSFEEALKNLIMGKIKHLNDDDIIPWTNTNRIFCLGKITLIRHIYFSYVSQVLSYKVNKVPMKSYELGRHILINLYKILSIAIETKKIFQNVWCDPPPPTTIQLLYLLFYRTKHCPFRDYVFFSFQWMINDEMNILCQITIFLNVP